MHTLWLAHTGAAKLHYFHIVIFIWVGYMYFAIKFSSLIYKKLENFIVHFILSPSLDFFDLKFEAAKITVNQIRISRNMKLCYQRPVHYSALVATLPSSFCSLLSSELVGDSKY